MKIMPGLGDIHISTATVSDLDELQAIENGTFSAPWSRKAFEAELEGNEFSHIYVARLNNPDKTEPQGENNVSSRMVGYICVWIIFEELRFMNIAVKAEMRRRGIASILLRKSIEMAMAHGAQRALLEVRESNQAAQALYMHFGFISYGSRRQYYTNPSEDAMLMALDPVSLPIE